MTLAPLTLQTAGPGTGKALLTAAHSRRLRAWHLADAPIGFVHPEEPPQTVTVSYPQSSLLTLHGSGPIHIQGDHRTEARTEPLFRPQGEHRRWARDRRKHGQNRAPRVCLASSRQLSPASLGFQHTKLILEQGDVGGARPRPLLPTSPSH